MSNYDRSPTERVFHALAFEVLAIGISTPLAAWIMGRPLAGMAVLTTVIAVIAILWNTLFNWGFDRAQTRYGFVRGYRMRTAHAMGFEAGLLIIVIPLIAAWLEVSLWQALVLDIGFILFYLPYGFIFNLGYDKIRERLTAGG